MYASTEVCGTKEEMFYAKLDSVLDQCPLRDALIVLGDFNAVTGSERAGYEICVGPHGSGTRTLRRHSWRSHLASLHAGSLPIPSNSQQEASTCRSQKFCGRPPGLLQVGLSYKQDRLPGIALHAHIAAVVADGLC